MSTHASNDPASSISFQFTSVTRLCLTRCHPMDDTGRSDVEAEIPIFWHLMQRADSLEKS